MSGKHKTSENGLSPDALRATILDAQICFALYSASSRMTKLYRPLLEPLGLTYPQYIAMLALWEKAPRSVGSLKEALGLDFGTLSPLLKRLEAQGLVDRRRDPEDERRVIVDLTEAGRALRVPASKVPEEIVCRVGLPRETMVSLRAALRQLNAALDENDAPKA